jgi:hypothetical protein
MGLSIAKGEVDGMVMAAGSSGSERDKGFVKGIVCVGFNTSPVFEGVPALSESIKLSPEDEKLLRTFSGTFTAERILFAPPGVPADRIQYLRDSWDKMMELKGFQKHQKSRHGVVAPPSKGVEIEEEVAMMNQLIEKYMK